MRSPLPVLLALCLSVPAAAQLEGAVQEASALIKSAQDAARCRPEPANAPSLRSSDFKWDYTLPELIRRFLEIYPSPKRLSKRAYWNAAKGRFELPYLAERGGPIALPPSFMRSVARHAEDALTAAYVDGVFFPDMGHSHFLIPEGLWERQYAPYPVERMSRLFEELFADPKLEILYHTAEQLTTRAPDGELVDDPRTRFRYETRNIVGANTGARGLKVLTNPQSSANTVVAVPGYFWWGGGFNISANEEGCFAFVSNGRTTRFDLSMFDLEPEPGAGDLKTGDATRPGPRFGECESLRRERAPRPF